MINIYIYKKIIVKIEKNIYIFIIKLFIKIINKKRLNLIQI